MHENNSEFKILVSTDNHLGYKEKHKTRNLDSFNAFDEVLKIAK
jgi:double-strand break repair protein MRE11